MTVRRSRHRTCWVGVGTEPGGCCSSAAAGAGAMIRGHELLAGCQHPGCLAPPRRGSHSPPRTNTPPCWLLCALGPGVRQVGADRLWQPEQHRRRQGHQRNLQARPAPVLPPCAVHTQLCCRDFPSPGHDRQLQTPKVQAISCTLLLECPSSTPTVLCWTLACSRAGLLRRRSSAPALLSPPSS